MCPAKLPPLPALKDFVHIYQLTARKILSQNYIMDMELTRKIVRQANIKEDAFVVEIGPGPGGITRAILEEPVRRLDVIEIDERFIPPLDQLVENSEGRLHIHHTDALKADIEPIWKKAQAPKHDWLDEPPNLYVVGNLPFHISSPLIIKYMREMSRRQGPWAFGRVPLALTFQSEVALRICAGINSPARSRISLVTQFVAEPKILFKIPGACFVPRADIQVSLVEFMPRREPLVPADFDVVQKVVRHMFMFKHKHAIKGLKTLYPKDMANDLAHELFRYARVNPLNTAVNIGMEELADMVICYEKQCKEHPGLFAFNYGDKKSLDDLKDTPKAQLPSYNYGIPQLNKAGVSLKEFDANWLPPSSLINNQK